MRAMKVADYGVDDFVGDLRAITARTDDPQGVIQQVRPLVARLATDRSWVRPEYYQAGEEQGFGVHLLHEEPDHTLAVFAVSWLPGRGAPPHNHGTWAVVAGVDGPELNTFWKRVDDGSREGYAEIVKAGEKVFRDGEVVSFLPDAIHSVDNTTDRVTLSLHVYGKHVNHTDRCTYDPEKNTTAPFKLKVE